MQIVSHHNSQSSLQHGSFIWAIFTVLIVLLPYHYKHIDACCGNDCPLEERCPHSCEDREGRCVDKSEHCAVFADYCENYFFRRCIRCACAKTCGLCKPKKHYYYSSSSSEETSTIATTTTSSTTTTTTTSSTTTLPASTTQEITTTLDPGVDLFRDDKRVKCIPCETRRKELKKLYDTYYPVSASTTSPAKLLSL